MAVTKITGAGLGLPNADGNALGGTSNEWSDLYLADSGVIYFGNDQDVTVTHVADTGLTVKNTHTSGNSGVGAVLTLQTGDTDVADGNILGHIKFQAPDEGTGTDAILVAAAIAAESEGDFSSSNNATSLVFQTGASEAAATKMTLTSAGALDVTGDITGSTINADGDTASGDNAAMGYTASEGLILTGQGSTNDITIKRDDDTAVLEVATGQSDIEVTGGSIFFGTANEGIYLGVTSATAANLLDDYEEGTWTGTLTATTSAPNSAVTTTGNYTKWGDMCYTTIAFVNVDTTGASGGVRVTGMPFNQSPSNQMTGNVTMHTLATLSSIFNISPFYQGTVCDFYGSQNQAGWTAVQINAGSGQYLYFTGVFRCA